MKWRRNMALILSCVMIIIAMPVAVFGEEELHLEERLDLLANEDNFQWSIIDGEYAEISGYTGNQSEVIVPEQIEGYPVSIVRGFRNNKFLQRVVIPEGVTQIGDKIFSGCINLSEVELPTTLEVVGSEAFQECASLKSITIPEGIVQIGKQTFLGCSSLAEVSLPDTLETLGTGAFKGCTNLERIDIPDKVTILESSSFSGCSNLEEVKLPAQLEEIWGDSFRNCVNLTSIQFPETLKVIEWGAFANCGLSEIEFPESVEQIGVQSFYECNQLKKVSIAGHAVNISSIAFAECANLTQVIVWGDFAEGGVDDIAFEQSVAFYGHAGSNANTYAAEEGSSFYKIDAPIGLKTEPQEGKILWTPITGAQKYWIYACDIEDGEYDFLGETGESQFADESLACGQTKYYKVCIHYDHEEGINGLLSNTVSLKKNHMPSKEWMQDEKSHWHVCQQCGTALSKENHVWDKGEVITEPTESSPGKVRYRCTDCGRQKEETIAAILKAPVLDQAVSHSYDSIQVKWQAVDGADGYIVYRKKVGEAWSKLADIPGEEVTAYLDTKLPTGTIFFYTVSAYKQDKNGMTESTYNKAGVNAKAALNKSEIISVSNPAAGELEIQWKEVPGADGYRIYQVGDPSGYKYVTQITNSKILSYTQKNLEIGKSYNYRVRAYRIIEGEKIFGAYSEPASGDCIMENQQGLQVPKLIKAYSYSYNKIKVVWEPVKGADGYHIYHKYNGSGWLKIKEIEGSETESYLDMGLLTNTAYTYTVRAYRWEMGEKVYSSYDPAGVSAKAVPNKSAILAVTNEAPGTLTIQWKKISGANGYRIYRIEEDGWKYVTQISSGNTLEYTEKGLEIGRSYNYKIRAYRTVNGEKVFGAYSDTKTGECAMTQPDKLRTPELTKAYSYSYNKIKVVWEAVEGADGYHIYHKYNGSGWLKIKEIEGEDAESYLDVGLLTNTTYTYTVRAFRWENNNKVYSSYDPAGVSAKAIPNKSAITAINSNSSGTLTIQWKKISGADGYRIYRVEDNGWEYVAQIGNGNTLSYTEKGLEKGKVCRYKVRAYRTVNGTKIFGAYSDTVSGTVK